MNRYLRSYWRWTTGGSKGRLAAGIGGPLVALVAIVGLAGGSTEEAPPTADVIATSAPNPILEQLQTPIISPLSPQAGRVQALVIRVVDGDTVEVDRALDGRATVRLIGIDTPETVAPGQPVGCYGREASAATKAMLEGKTVFLEKDVSETDRFQRLLRYVYLEDGQMANELLVRQGFAQVATFPPDVKHIPLFMTAQQEARNANRGLWAACMPVAQAPTARPATTVAAVVPTPRPAVAAPPEAATGNCHPSYPTICLPPTGPDIDCGDIPQYRRFTVLPPDPHRLDGTDGDGIGCES